MSKKLEVMSIEDLRKEFVESGDTSELATNRQELAERVIEENKALLQKIANLEQVIKDLQTTTDFGLSVSPEELICISQIKILEGMSNSRELTLDEVKKLDLLIKNHRLIKNKSTENLNPQYRDVSEAELVAIATKKE